MMHFTTGAPWSEVARFGPLISNCVEPSPWFYSILVMRQAPNSHCILPESIVNDTIQKTLPRCLFQ